MKQDTRTLWQWLRAIRDVGTLRVRFDCDVLIAAWEMDLVDCRAVTGEENALDFHLTAKGKAQVELQRLAA